MSGIRLISSRIFNRKLFSKSGYLQERSHQILLLIILLFFAIVFSLISLVNHYLFRTAALDLGLFNQAIYDFAHFRLNHNTLAPTPTDVPANFFGDHFSLITVLYAPFYYLFGSYTLLLVQIVSILIGGLGVYKLAKDQLHKRFLPLVVIVQFFLIWGSYSALAFDFHNNVVGAMMVPWLALFVIKGKKIPALIVFFLMLIAREDMAIWAVFILLALIVRGGISSWRKYLKFEIPLIIIAFVYFVMVVGLVMPALDPFEGPSHQLQRYSNFGSSGTEIVRNVITHPLYALSQFFDKGPNGYYYGMKSESHLMVIVSGGVSLLLAPYYLIALIPVYLQKFLANEPNFWGINYEYSVQFVPIISLAFIDLLVKVKRRKPELVAAAAFMIVAMTCGSLFQAILTQKIYLPIPVNVNFVSEAHYESRHNISELKAALERIPKDAALSASSPLVPRLSFREKIYLFPNVQDAEYIALLNDRYFFWPLNAVTFKNELTGLLKSPDFETIYDKDDLFIFKRK